jgi:tetraacyldisaccharide 4'-kinase
MDVVDLRSLKPPDEYGGPSRALLLPLLVPLSGLYGAGMGLWRMLPVKPGDAGLPVVSVGSLAVGGTGKTPVCMRRAGRFRDLGRRVCILSRGYRRKSVCSPLVVSDGRRLLAGVEDAGDEPYMMARRLRGVGVVVGKDRLAAAAEAKDRLGADLLILDDGFQVRNLARLADVLCFDHASLKEGNSLLPWGTLGEGWSAIRPEHLVVVLLKDGASRPSRAELARLGEATVCYAARSAPIVADAEGQHIDGSILAEGRFGVVSGIARPAAFERSCMSTGASIPVSVRFRDHHWYSEGDAASIREIIGRYDCTGILTTEKDIWKLPDALREISLILIAQLDFLEPEAFWKNLDDRLGADTCLPKNRISSS